VTIRAQVTGTLAELGFAEGEEVKAGQLLFRIDPRPFAADLRQAEAALARTEAQLTNAVAEACRITGLFEKKFVSENERDLALTAVAILRATARADAATVENARIRLDYCEIRAPIAGCAGRRLVDAGNQVLANASPLVTINQVRPAAVGFTIPQQEMARVRGRPDARELAVEAMLPGGASGPERGVLTFMDNAVDRTTGTLALKAQFPNDALRLWPGQFVAVRMVVAVESNAVVIPYRAVQNGQNGTYVYVVQADASVTNRPVKIARLVEDESVVEEGLQPGELVVADGQQRVGPGSIVKDAAAGDRSPESGVRKPESGARKPGHSAP
jgi:multidrug efflux system membrane fusion protein